MAKQCFSFRCFYLQHFLQKSMTKASSRYCTISGNRNLQEHVSRDFSDFLLLDNWGGSLSLKWIIFTWLKLPIYGTYFLSSFGFQAVVWWTLRYLAVMYEQCKVGRGWYNKNMKWFPTLCIAAIVTVGDKNGCPGGFFRC